MSLKARDVITTPGAAIDPIPKIAVIEPLSRFPTRLRHNLYTDPNRFGIDPPYHNTLTMKPQCGALRALGTLHVTVPGPGSAAVMVGVEACPLGVHSVTLSGSGSFPSDPKSGQHGPLAIRVSDPTASVSVGADLGAEWDAASLRLTECMSWLTAYFENPGEVSKVEHPRLHLQGLPPDGFTNAVLVTLRQAVPVGRTLTYGGLAQLAGGSRSSARAVGNAMRRNPVPLLVPCHRVVPASGGTGSFQGRLTSQLKAWLLQHEEAAIPSPGS